MSTTSEHIDELSVLRQAFLELKEMRSKLEAIEHSGTEPIAIIGMGCRFPGATDSPEAFWQLLRNGRDAVSEIPPEKWNIDPEHYQSLDSHSKACIRHGGFLEQMDAFDPEFFRISPQEANKMDPQHRLLLEVSWEALEHAGQAPDKLIGSRTGVFLGITTNDYLHLQVRSGSFTDLDAFTTLGNSLNFAAGRLSYHLGLQGPCFAMDAACASSLVSVHLACQSLRAGECHLALAGGVNLILSPYRTIIISKTRELSPEGRCKTFDAAADGFVRGEGCGIIVLKRLSDAVANDDTILALIRGSAVNHNGPSSGFTVPNGLAQQALIREALLKAGVRPEQVNYVEAHGTGTSFGDPIEVRALGAVLCEERPLEQPLVIGSVKTNIGHLESAAGVASLMKVVLALQHEEIPQHLHLRNPSPHIPWDTLPIMVPTQRTPWPSGNGRRIAGVSAFGMNGTISHMIMEEAPVKDSPSAQMEKPLHLLTLSAKTEGALQEMAGRFAKHLHEQPSQSLANVCFTANTGRAHFPHRLASVAETLVEMGQQLAAVGAGEAPATAGVMRGHVQDTRRPQVGFLFTGQGSEYADMGRQLFETQPTFRSSLEECERLLRPHLERPLLSVLYGEDGGLLDQTIYAQPALFSVDYALCELWRSWGVEPDVVLGPGIGEYVAACSAGVFTLADGLKLVCARARLGGEGAIEDVSDEFEREAGTVRCAAPQVQWISNLRGEVVRDEEVTTAGYWRRHVRECVPFSKAIETLAGLGCEVYVEVGPGATLIEMGRQCVEEENGIWLASLRKERGEWQQMLETLGAMYLRGVEVDWAGVDRDYQRRRVELPTYPFRRERYWIDTASPRPKALPREPQQR